MTIKQTTQSGGEMSEGVGKVVNRMQLTKTETDQRRIEWSVGAPELAEWKDTLSSELLVYTTLGEDLQALVRPCLVPNGDALKLTTERTFPRAERATNTVRARVAFSP